MELSHKTTVLFPAELHAALTDLARRRGTSLGELVRAACKQQYKLGSVEERLAAVRRLASLELPVDTPEELAKQSVPRPEELLP